MVSYHKGFSSDRFVKSSVPKTTLVLWTTLTQFIPPENTGKPTVFKGNIRQIWVN